MIREVSQEGPPANMEQSFALICTDLKTLSDQGACDSTISQLGKFPEEDAKNGQGWVCKSRAAVELLGASVKPGWVQQKARVSS